MGALIDGALAKDSLDAILAPGASYANAGASAGYPTVIVPAGLISEKTATGISFMGTAWSEAKLLRIAAAYEGGSHRRGSVHAPTRDQHAKGNGKDRDLRMVDFAKPVHEEHEVGAERAIDQQFTAPMTVGMLLPEQIVLSPADRFCDLRVLGDRRRMLWP